MKNLNPSYEWNAEDALSSAMLAEMTLEEALYRRGFDEAAMEGDWHKLRECPFIGKIYFRRARRRKIPKLIKETVLNAGECKYCGSGSNLTIDHIVPLSRGGKDDLPNLQCLCSKCNCAKHAMTEDEYFKKIRL